MFQTAKPWPRQTPWSGWIVASLGASSLVSFKIWSILEYQTISFAFGFFVFTSLIAIILFYAAAIGADNFSNQPAVSGRVVALIPSYNENQERLHDAVRALLNGSVVPDLIHVVDDGSNKPVKRFYDHRVIWTRQENGGKRSAQANVLNKYTRDFDFIVTVDSDSVVSYSALENALKAFRDPEVMAVTGLITVRSRRKLVDWLNDMDMVAGILLVRRARAAFGAVTPTSGAFSVYRSAPILDNLDDYVNSGTFSDDRRMAHYCLMRGKVVSVDGALVDTDMPDTIKGIWRQRVRWYKGYWKYLPWEVANLNGVGLFLRWYNTILAAIFPLAMAWILVIMPFSGKGIYWPALLLWLALTYCQSLLYAMRHPTAPALQAWAAWLFLTPLLLIFQLLLVRPAMYWALLTFRSNTWNGSRRPLIPKSNLRKTF